MIFSSELNNQMVCRSFKMIDWSDRGIEWVLSGVMLVCFLWMFDVVTLHMFVWTGHILSSSNIIALSYCEMQYTSYI